MPAGYYRDETLGFGQLELRHPLEQPIELALFLDTAFIDGLHWTAGGGLRLVLPPDRRNVTRLDVGFGEGTWGVVVSWGDAW